MEPELNTEFSSSAGIADTPALLLSRGAAGAWVSLLSGVADSLVLLLLLLEALRSLLGAFLTSFFFLSLADAPRGVVLFTAPPSFCRI